MSTRRVFVLLIGNQEGAEIDHFQLLQAQTALEEGRLRELKIAPEDAGLERTPQADLSGGDAAQNARRLEALITGEKGPGRDAVVLNAAAALVIAGRAKDLREAAVAAAEAIDGGRVRSLVELLKRRR